MYSDVCSPAFGGRTHNKQYLSLTPLYNEIARKDNIFSDFSIAILLNGKTLIFGDNSENGRNFPLR